MSSKPGIRQQRKEKPDGARIFSRCFAAPPPSPGSCCGAEPQRAGGWASDTPSLLQYARPEEPGPRSASHSAELFHGGYTVLQVSPLARSAITEPQSACRNSP
ncbi:hypothetical protein NQZ68_016829 [Dissostichus eleginoides]|nr:hypothetical protein NQZ68_016829 [Dissostichus eleginoides]